MQLREEAGEVVCSRAQRERREIGNYEGGWRVDSILRIFPFILRVIGSH